MEKTVNVTLYKDTDGTYAVSVNPLLVTVSPLDEDGNPVVVNWVLAEDPSNPGFPNARFLTASFDVTPTPFTVVIQGFSLPLVENYLTPESSNGAMATSPSVQDGSVGTSEDDSRLYKYTLTVETNDGQQIIVDPHIRVRRKSISRNHVDT